MTGNWLPVPIQLTKLKPLLPNSTSDQLPVTDFIGGADRDRTGDPLVANQVLSQLSYSPMIAAFSS